MDPSSLSPDDIAYRRALRSAKEKHEEGGGTDSSIHQPSSLMMNEEGNKEGSPVLSSLSSERNKEASVLNTGKAEGENDRLSMKKNEGGGENIRDKNTNDNNNNNNSGINQSSNIESNTRASELSEGREEGLGMEASSEGQGGDNDLDSIPLGTGGGGGASSGSMSISQQDINRRMTELESIDSRHPLPKLRDAHDQPKAIASTFQPPAHLPPSNASGYRFHAVNEHMRSGGGKAPRSQKMIQQPGGKYGQRY